MTRPKFRPCTSCQTSNQANRKTCSSCYQSLSTKKKLKEKVESLDTKWGQAVRANRNTARIMDSARIAVRKLEAVGYKPVLFFGRKAKALNTWEANVITYMETTEISRHLLEKMQKAYEFLLSNDGCEEDAGEQLSASNWSTHPVASTQNPFKVSGCCSNEKSCRKHESKLNQSASFAPFFLQTDQIEEPSSVNISVPVKEPHLEDGAINLPQLSLNQTVKSESLDVTSSVFTDSQPLHPSSPEHECRGSECRDNVSVVSSCFTQAGHFIKIEKEEETEALPGSESESLTQPELNDALKYQEAELEQDDSPVVAKEETHYQRTDLLCCPTCTKTFSDAAALNVIKTHSYGIDHCCGICGKLFSLADHLKHHRHVHTEERAYRCNICSRSYIHPSRFKVHMQVHTREKPYTCSYCEK